MLDRTVQPSVRGVDPDTFTYNMLMDGYCLAGKLDIARDLFVSVQSKENGPDVSYSIMINGYCKNWKARLKKQENLFGKMQFNNIAPDSCTNNIFVDGLCKNDCVSEALELFHKLEDCQFEFRIEMFNSLSNGLRKTRKLETAWYLFYGLSNKGLEPTVIAYSIMIHGLHKD
ncbi:hypothetical protein REPUB_Repub12eG0108500 [Reevesia pubescens]